MLMKYEAPTTPSQRLSRTTDAIAGLLWSYAKQLYKAIKHRRHIAVLLHQEDHLLADIGVTRSDLHQAIRQPLWRDPTDALRRRAVAARSVNLKSAFMGWRSAEEQNRRALAELDHGELSSLSDLGRRVRHDTRQRARA